MLIIGDVHGKLKKYKKIIDNYHGPTIQIGDFGFREEHEWHRCNINPQKHKICFGNHDDPNYRYFPHSLGDYYYDSEMKLMSVRGADSYDKDYRLEGVNWWRNEELSYSEMQKAINAYEKCKPEIMITHECPQIIREMKFGIYDKSNTSNGLQMMFEIHKPKLWVFGHHHQSEKFQIFNTFFVALRELETYEV